MDTSVLYNVSPQEAFGALIAVYFYLTGLSAGSFVLSTLAFVFGIEKYKPIGKIGVVLAALFLILAPLALLVHVGQPFKAWHLFVHLNVTSPITEGGIIERDIASATHQQLADISQWRSADIDRIRGSRRQG